MISTKRLCGHTSRWRASYSGMFEIVHRLYGISVMEKPGVPVWDPQVKYYEIYDESRPHGNELVGRFLCGLVSAREQTRRRLDGYSDHRRGARRPAGAARRA